MDFVFGQDVSDPHVENLSDTDSDSINSDSDTYSYSMQLFKLVIFYI